ncbi:Mobile element protein [Candidatus Enterovibrio escicola]|uniref:Mobile element protein n=1 Tax=Candidatus Enterovibrio escicola TaxID=1927127 RepID=A0A2A5T3W5_9GAMM|nr:Mobile element protein [Candidatus Enterovibrio escacola]
MFTHEVIAAEVSLVSVSDNEVLPKLLNPLRRRIEQVSVTELMTQEHVTTC